MTILNKHISGIPPGAIYVGRGSRWGNPFIIGRDGVRDEVVKKYEARLNHQIASGEVSLEDLNTLYNKNLVCFCAPRKCHADVLERAANWAHEQLS